jgi:hypothetical protein
MDFFVGIMAGTVRSDDISEDEKALRALANLTEPDRWEAWEDTGFILINVESAEKLNLIAKKP